MSDYDYAEGEQDDHALEEAEENENIEWYRREVGEDPDEGILVLFSN